MSSAPSPNPAGNGAVKRTLFPPTARLRQIRFALLALLFTAALSAAVHLAGAFSGTLDEVGYSTLPVTDPVEQLNQKISAGDLTLTRELGTGYLRAVLDALHVPVASQMLVFSRTSLQQRIIYPDNPRAIYFNDSVAVGWTKGEPFVEVAAQDARQGIHFYTVDQFIREPGARPKFDRHDDTLCLNCHESYAALDIPGMLIRSSPIGADGFPNRDQGNYVPDHRTAFEERFGGWYVTGDSGSLHHLGNQFGGAPLKPFESADYLSNSSDIVPLLVFTHQMRMMNLITRLAWEFRVQKPSELADAVNEFVDYLLFRGEPKLPSPVHGASGFEEKFAAQALRDPKGRSLRDLDLKTRLLRYPCSYMIYSEAFDGMPDAAKEAIYRRVRTLLAADPRPEARAALEILRSTKKDFPAR